MNWFGLDRDRYPKTLGETVAYFVRCPEPQLWIGLTTAMWLWRASLGPMGAGDLLAILALLAWWPMQEWLIHVNILHLKPFKLFGRTIDPVLGRKHRRHHRDPLNLKILFIPVEGAIPGLMVYAAILWASGFHPVAVTFVATYLLGTLHYEWVHFICHTPYTPQSAYYRRLWRNHRLHHFKNEHYWMGVTMLSGDRLMGTDPHKSDVPLSGTCRTLGVTSDVGPTVSPS